MHGLIFETSIWLLAGSTRLLPNQLNHQHQKMQMTGWQAKQNPKHGQFQLNPYRIKFQMPSLQLWLRSKSDANYWLKAVVPQTSPHQGRVLGFPSKDRNATKHSKPFFVLKQPYSMSSTQPRITIPYRHPKGPQGLANIRKPQFRTQTQLSRMGKQDTDERSANQPWRRSYLLPPIVREAVPRL